MIRFSVNLLYVAKIRAVMHLCEEFSTPTDLKAAISTESAAELTLVI